MSNGGGRSNSLVRMFIFKNYDDAEFELPSQWRPVNGWLVAGTLFVLATKLQVRGKMN